jgi:hypothetical protein
MRLEGEWRVTRRIGLKLELGCDRLRNVAPSVAGGVSFSLLHLERAGFHAQAVLYARWPLDKDAGVLLDPAEPANGVAAGIHAAWQWKLLAARAEVTAGYGGEIAHAPIRANGALLFGSLNVFAAFEVLSDFARADPLTLAVEGEVRQMIDELPFRVTVAVPFQPRAGGSAAVILRVLVAVD